MKINTVALSVLLGGSLLQMLVAPAQAAAWIGGASGVWENDANWNPALYPGSASATDNVANITTGVNISPTVSLSSALSQNLTSLRLDGNNAGQTATLNISGSANLTMAATSQILINESGGTDDNATINQSGGTVTLQHYMAIARDGGVATYNLTGGTFNYTGATGGGRRIWLRPDVGAAATAIFSVGGNGTYLGDGGASTAHIDMQTYDSRLLISGNASFTQKGAVAMNTATVVGSTALLRISGSNVNTLEIGTLEANKNALNLTGEARIEFITDAGGVSTLTVGTLNLGTGGDKGNLYVDSTGAFGHQTLTLFSYTTLQNGTFGDVSVLGAPTLYSGTWTGNVNDLSLGQYYLDYATGVGNKDIVLYYNVIPEPSTSMMLLIGVAALVFRCRRPRQMTVERH